MMQSKEKFNPQRWCVSRDGMIAGRYTGENTMTD
jgi:hypothetical protein